MRKSFIICLLALSAYHLSAQQDPMFSRYMFNTMYLFNNPAYSGSHRNWTTNALYRTQWLGLEGAPQTVYAGAEGMIGRKQNAGLGASLFYDKIGLDRVADLSANYAYHIHLNDENTLALGIKAGAFFYKSLLGQAVLDQSGDPIYAGDVQGVVPRVGVGAYWYTEDAFAGLSIPTALAFDDRTDFNIDLDKSGTLRRHYYAYGGYVFHLDNKIDLKPSLLLKYQPSAPLEADINLNVWFNNLFSCGLSYRTNDAVSMMLEVPLGKRLSVGYAFDHTVSRLRNFSTGTHELMVGYNFVSDLKVAGVRRQNGMRF
jgi:type IX secretion system PorP/SprF family membrane protein